MGYTQRLAVALLAIFGGMALFLAAIGFTRHVVFGFAKHARARHANGARRARAGHSPALVLSRGLRLTIAGVAIGAVAALLLTRLMGNLLYKVSPRDPIAFGAALIILLAVALLACFLPARRATRHRSRSAR